MPSARKLPLVTNLQLLSMDKWRDTEPDSIQPVHDRDSHTCMLRFLKLENEMLRKLVITLRRDLLLVHGGGGRGQALGCANCKELGDLVAFLRQKERGKGEQRDRKERYNKQEWRGEGEGRGQKVFERFKDTDKYEGFDLDLDVGLDKYKMAEVKAHGHGEAKNKHSKEDGDMQYHKSKETDETYTDRFKHISRAKGDKGQVSDKDGQIQTDRYKYTGLYRRPTQNKLGMDDSKDKYDTEKYKDKNKLTVSGINKQGQLQDKQLGGTVNNRNLDENKHKQGIGKQSSRRNQFMQIDRQGSIDANKDKHMHPDKEQNRMNNYGRDKGKKKHEGKDQVRNLDKGKDKDLSIGGLRLDLQISKDQDVDLLIDSDQLDKVIDKELQKYKDQGKQNPNHHQKEGHLSKDCGEEAIHTVKHPIIDQKGKVRIKDGEGKVMGKKGNKDRDKDNSKGKGRSRSRSKGKGDNIDKDKDKGKSKGKGSGFSKDKGADSLKDGLDNDKKQDKDTRIYGLASGNLQRDVSQQSKHIRKRQSKIYDKENATVSTILTMQHLDDFVQAFNKLKDTAKQTEDQNKRMKEEMLSMTKRRMSHTSQMSQIGHFGQIGPMSPISQFGVIGPVDHLYGQFGQYGQMGHSGHFGQKGKKGQRGSIGLIGPAGPPGPSSPASRHTHGQTQEPKESRSVVYSKWLQMIVLQGQGIESLLQNNFITSPYYE